MLILLLNPLGKLGMFQQILRRQTPLIIGDFAITVLIGDVTPDQHYWVRGQGECSSKQAMGSGPTKVSFPPWHLWHAGPVWLYTQSVFASASRKVNLVSSSVSTDKFQIIPQRRCWLRIKPVLPKLSPTRGTALYSWEVKNKGLRPTRTGKCPQQDAFPLFSMGKWKAPWMGIGEEKQGIISEFLHWDSTLENVAKESFPEFYDSLQKVTHLKSWREGYVNWKKGPYTKILPPPVYSAE